MLAFSRDLFRDSVAGLVAAVVLIANIVSFGALMFPAALSSGMPMAIWAMLIGSSMCGVWIALKTSLPPIATGIDSPTATVLVLLSASAGSNVLATGRDAETAVQAVMLIFTGATAISGALLLILGFFRCGVYLRFVPYPVIGGFLAATGWFLIAGGFRMSTGRVFSLSGITVSWTLIEVAKLAAAIAVLLVLSSIRRWFKSALATPIALLLMWLIGALILRTLGLAAPEHGWHFRSMGELTRWAPFNALRHVDITFPTMTRLIPELLAVTTVALISLITKVSSLEVARQTSGDLDKELRTHGAASLVVAPFGGFIASVQTGTSRLLEQAGGATRTSGIICALVLGAVGIGSFDLPGVVPIAIVAGLVFNLGYTFIADALWRPYVQRAWSDLMLALAIMIVCVQFGYLVGVLAGLLCSCVMFAISYARRGVVRRHATRAQFAGYVDRRPEASAYLRNNGEAIHIYWLSGYIFFGSSEGLFERVRTDIENLPRGRVAYVILDFGMTTGADSSAVVSLAKLRDYCERRNICLVYCALPQASDKTRNLSGVLADKKWQRSFPDVNRALAWCEDELLAQSHLNQDAGVAEFEAWLQDQLGVAVKATDLMKYLERKDTDGSQVLYREGEPADTIDLIAAGSVTVEITSSDGESVRVRRIMTHTVLGEMGFVRRSSRSATVCSDGPATLFTLTRASFEHMRQDRPDLANAFDDFILRILADRIDFANHALEAMSR